MKVLIDISEEVYKDIMIHNREMRESGKSAYYFEGLIQSGTPIPDNATNGDVIKAMFPNTHMEYRMWTENLYFYETDWWNAPYKRS